MPVLDKRWMLGGTTKDEGYKIVSEDAYIGNKDDGYKKEHIATAYDQEVAKYIVDSHNLLLAVKYVKDHKKTRKREGAK